jgi:hypothetical protein
LNRQNTLANIYLCDFAKTPEEKMLHLNTLQKIYEMKNMKNYDVKAKIKESSPNNSAKKYNNRK